jgi:hypothetical protein
MSSAEYGTVKLLSCGCKKQTLTYNNSFVENIPAKHIERKHEFICGFA